MVTDSSGWLDRLTFKAAGKAEETVSGGSRVTIKLKYGKGAIPCSVLPMARAFEGDVFCTVRRQT